jgi:hypothetical protein
MPVGDTARSRGSPTVAAASNRFVDNRTFARVCRSPPGAWATGVALSLLLRRSGTGAVPSRLAGGSSRGFEPALRSSACSRERVRLRLPPRVSRPFRSRSGVSGSVDACSCGRAVLRVLTGPPAPGPPSKRSARAARVASSHQIGLRGRRGSGGCIPRRAANMRQRPTWPPQRHCSHVDGRTEIAAFRLVLANWTARG